MLTFKLFWATIVQKNPLMAQDSVRITLSVAELERLMNKAFQAGHAAGWEQHRELGNRIAEREGPLARHFAGLFGAGHK
jgi:hypothetical protein